MELFDWLVQQNCHAKAPARRRLGALGLEWLYGCEINCGQIDKSVKFAHHARGSIVIAAKVCANAVIFQNVTIGTNLRFNKVTDEWENVGNPVIGEGVIVADGAKVLGPIIVGDGSVIAAGAIVTRDVPSNTIVYGVNRQKPLDPDTQLLFHQPMVSREAMLAANERLIARYRETGA